MRDTLQAVEERFEVVRGEDEARDAGARVRALRAAYRARHLVVSDDRRALARARLRGGRAIDARDVADAMLSELLAAPRRRARA